MTCSSVSDDQMHRARGNPLWFGTEQDVDSLVSVSDWGAARVAALQRGDLQAVLTYDFLGRAAKSSQCLDWPDINLKKHFIYAIGNDPKTKCLPHGAIRPVLYLDYT